MPIGLDGSRAAAALLPLALAGTLLGAGSSLAQPAPGPHPLVRVLVNDVEISGVTATMTFGDGAVITGPDAYQADVQFGSCTASVEARYTLVGFAFSTTLPVDICRTGSCSAPGQYAANMNCSDDAEFAVASTGIGHPPMGLTMIFENGNYQIDGLGSSFVFQDFNVQDEDQQACINRQNRGMKDAMTAQYRRMAKCLPSARRRDESPDDCIATARKQTSRVRESTDRALDRLCTTTPDFGFTDADTATDSGIEASFRTIRDILGQSLEAALIEAAALDAAAGNTRLSRCQDSVVQQTRRCLRARFVSYNRCKASGLADGSIQNSIQLGNCLSTDIDGQIAKRCDPVDGTVARQAVQRCESRGVDLSLAFSNANCLMGETNSADTFSACISRITACRTCRAARDTDDLSEDCDLRDDGIDNDTCT